MLRVIVQANAAAAQSYYKGSTGGGGEYYAEGQEQAGEWGGLAGKRLGLEGRVEKEAFDALCENKNPETGERITARTKMVRRVGFDLNFHVPKSVSVVYGLTGEADILQAFKDSIRETLADLETETRTRVRTGGKDETRLTGNMAYSLFVHSTSRPVDGVPDPHLSATELLNENNPPIHVWREWIARRLKSLQQLIERGQIVSDQTPGRTVEFLVRSR